MVQVDDWSPVNSVWAKCCHPKLKQKSANMTPSFLKTAPSIDRIVIKTTMLFLVCFSAGLCPEGWALFGGHCYLLVTSQLTWENARTNCQQQSSSFLVDINSAEEQTFVVSFVSGLTWIGYNRVGASTFGWTRTGSLGTFTAWLDGEPTGESGVGDCVEIRTNQGLWNNASCAESKPSICKAGKYLM